MATKDDIAEDFEDNALADWGEAMTWHPDPKEGGDDVSFTAIFTDNGGSLAMAAGTGIDANESATLGWLNSALAASAIDPRGYFTRDADSTNWRPVADPANHHGVCSIRLGRMSRKKFGRG